MRDRIPWGLIWLVFGVCCYFIGHAAGRRSGAEQMARHLLNAKYHTGAFVSIAEDASSQPLQKGGE